MSRSARHSAGVALALALALSGLLMGAPRAILADEVALEAPEVVEAADTAEEGDVGQAVEEADAEQAPEVVPEEAAPEAVAEDAPDGEIAEAAPAAGDDLAEAEGQAGPEEAVASPEEPGEPEDAGDGALYPQGEGGRYGNAEWSYSKGELKIVPVAYTDGWLSNPSDEDDYTWPWHVYADEITSVKIQKNGDAYVVASSCYDMFKDFSSLCEANLSGLDNTKAINFENMFEGCDKLTTITVGDRYDVCPNGVPTKNHAFPANPRGLSYWWSTNDGCFVKLSDIRKNRSGVGNADHYRVGARLSFISLVDMGDEAIYTGSPIKVVPRLYMDKEGGRIELKKDKDFKVLGYGSDVVNAGSTYVDIGSTNSGYCEDIEGIYVQYGYTISPRPINEVDVEMDAGFEFDGSAVKPEPILTFNGMTLKKGKDYTLAYKNNDKPGTATLTISGKGNYSSKALVDFEIFNPLTNLVYAQVTGVEDVVYNGQVHAPEPTVTLNGTVLTRGKDYSIYYEDNVKPGIATVNIEAISPYDGGTYATFIIAFTDVPKSFWGYKKVHEAASLGLVGGYSGAKDGQYGPNDNVTRGQAAVMLWNMAEKPEPGAGAKDFPDVADPKAYYYKAVRWASSTGVISGYASTGTFGPNDLVTREQLAVMIANYAGKVGGKAVSGSAADYAAMKDASSVSAWARASIGWCYKNAIMGGTSDGRINPQGNATRAETAKMMVGLFYLVGD